MQTGNGEFRKSADKFGEVGECQGEEGPRRNEVKRRAGVEWAVEGGVSDGHGRIGVDAVLV